MSRRWSKTHKIESVQNSLTLSCPKCLREKLNFHAPIIENLGS